MKWNEKCDDLKCVQKLTQNRLSLTHYANKSSRRWADKNMKWSESPWNQSGIGKERKERKIAFAFAITFASFYQFSLIPCLYITSKAHFSDINSVSSHRETYWFDIDDLIDKPDRKLFRRATLHHLLHPKTSI